MEVETKTIIKELSEIVEKLDTLNGSLLQRKPELQLSISNAKTILEHRRNEIAYYDLCEEVANCKNCALHDSRINVVVGAGKIPAKIMLIGEAPGEVEDQTGIPFVGPAGQLLDKMLKAIKWNKKEVYITNIVKCHPPNNRKPDEKEIHVCKQFLQKQIQMVKPEVIVCIGSVAANAIIHPKFTITKEHGVWFDRVDGTKAIAIFHPSYLLRLETLDEKACLEAKQKVWNTLRDIDKFIKRG